jgi:MYXO-CTERM domain-containing protein
MNKKLLIVCLAFLAITNYAYAYDKLIGSWENQTNEGWIDQFASAATGWSATVYVDDPSLYGTKYWFSDDWSTDGRYSLKANVTGWDWFERIDVHADFFTYQRLEFDIFAVPQEGSNATWAEVSQIAYTCRTKVWTSLANSEFAIGMDQTFPCHFVFDYTQYKTSAYASPTDDFGSFVFALNADAPVYMYIDNVRLTALDIPDPPVPAEPATLALLGFGGLALLRRRK